LSKVQHASLVAGELGDLGHGRVLPDADLILAEAVGRDQLFPVVGPLERANLRFRINGIQQGTGRGVPKLDGTIGRSSSGCEKILLPRAPCEGLDCSQVFLDGELWGLLLEVPHVQDVIVTARGELFAVEAPLETADFTGVVGEGGDEGFTEANIPVADGGVERTGGEDRTIPSEGTNTTQVSLQGANLGTSGNVPDLDFVGIVTDGEVLGGGGPRNAADGGVFRKVNERGRGACRSIPEIDDILEGHSQYVRRRPVKEVEVVVINQSWAIKSGERLGRDGRSALGSVLGVENLQLVLVGRVRGRCLVLQSQNLAFLDVGGVEERLGEVGLVLGERLGFDGSQRIGVLVRGD